MDKHFFMLLWPIELRGNSCYKIQVKERDMRKSEALFFACHLSVRNAGWLPSFLRKFWRTFQPLSHPPCLVISWVSWTLVEFLWLMWLPQERCMVLREQELQAVSGWSFDLAWHVLGKRSSHWHSPKSNCFQRYCKIQFQQKSPISVVGLYSS